MAPREEWERSRYNSQGFAARATASGKEGVELAREMGAHAVIDGKRVDIDDQARRFAPNGVDPLLALAGGDALEKCLNTLRPGGRIARNGVELAPKKATRHETDPLRRYLASSRIRATQ